MATTLNRRSLSIYELEMKQNKKTNFLLVYVIKHLFPRCNLYETSVTIKFITFKRNVCYKQKKLIEDQRNLCCQLTKSL